MPLHPAKRLDTALAGRGLAVGFGEDTSIAGDGCGGKEEREEGDPAAHENREGTDDGGGKSGEMTSCAQSEAPS
jgi:hypothetical protein